MRNPQANIFIVDDEPLLTTMLSDFLKEQHPGLQLHSFLTGEACLQAIHQQPDMVVLDYYLNSREKTAANGIDILKELKSKNPELPVVMLSSQEGYGTAAKSIAYGAVHYVPKGQDAFEEIRQLIAANV